MEKPTSILISGTYDHHYNTSEIGTDFRLCGRDEATHVSVFLIDEQHSEPVRDFDLGVPANLGAYADALTLAAQLAHEHDVGIVDRFQKKVSLTATSKSWSTVKYQSIQVAATAHGDGDIHVCEECSSEKTHYSVYLRDSEGLVEHVEDFAAGEDLYSQALARVLAFNKAAHLSMQHQVPIEPIN